MSIRALRYFLALAECLSFTRAAERCSVTQSTLSIQVRRLEEYLGVALFDRDHAHVSLTAAGRRQLRLARSVVAAADRMIALGRAERERFTPAADRPRGPARRRHRRTAEVVIEEINCAVASRD